MVGTPRRAPRFQSSTRDGQSSAMITVSPCLLLMPLLPALQPRWSRYWARRRCLMTVRIQHHTSLTGFGARLTLVLLFSLLVTKTAQRLFVSKVCHDLVA